MTPTPPTPSPTPLAPQARLILGIAAPVLLLWSLAGLTVALRPQLLGGAQPAWMLAGFEIINAVAAVLIGMLALGRFREGPAITAAFAALAVAVGAMLGSVSANNVIGETSLIPYMIARLILAAIIAIPALLLAIHSLFATIKLVIGGALVTPVAAGLGLFVLGKLGGVLSVFDTLHPAMSLIAAILAGLAGLVAVSAGGHLIIAAFERDHTEPAPRQPSRLSKQAAADPQ
ncbi:MAG: hypothetical protein AAFZ67_12490 [Planctomycetota bacterium]